MQYLKMELTCLCIMAFLTYYYRKSKRPRTSSNLACGSMLVAGCVNLVLECVAAVLANNIRVVPQWLAKFAYQLFFISLFVFMFLAAYYILSIVQSVNLLSINTQLMLAVPILCAVIMVLVSPLYFQNIGSGVCPTGPMTYSYQFAVLLYMGMGIFYVFRHSDAIRPSIRNILPPVMLIVIILSILHFFVPSMLMSGAGAVLLSLCVVISLENPDEYIERSGAAFNRKAFDLMVKDGILRGGQFTAVFVVYREMSLLEEKFGKDCVRELIAQLKDYIEEVFKLDMYIPLEGCAAILVSDRKRVETIVFGLQQRFDEAWFVLEVPLNVYANVCSFEIPDPYSNVDDLMQAVMEQSESAQEPVVLIDRKLGIKNRQAFDRTMLMMHQNRQLYTSIYYLIADINGMGATNAKHGIIAGDQLLKDCADVLTRAVGEGVDVYRVGGDEFAILLQSKTDKDMRDLLDKIQEEREACNKERGQLPLELSIGYSRYYEDSDRTFNSMITRAEFQMNNLKKHMKQEVDLYNTTRLGTKILKQ